MTRLPIELLEHGILTLWHAVLSVSMHDCQSLLVSGECPNFQAALVGHPAPEVFLWAWQPPLTPLTYFGTNLQPNTWHLTVYLLTNKTKTNTPLKSPFQKACLLPKSKEVKTLNLTFLFWKCLTYITTNQLINFSQSSCQSFKGAEKCLCALKGHTCYLRPFFTSLLSSFDTSKTVDNGTNFHNGVALSKRSCSKPDLCPWHYGRQLKINFTWISTSAWSEAQRLLKQKQLEISYWLQWQPEWTSLCQPTLGKCVRF